MGRLATAATVVLLVAACSSGGDEPAGLSTDSATGASEPAPSSTGTEPAGTATDGASEPTPSFTQPFVPGEPSVITLAEELPIEPPDGATDEEREVLRAAGRFMASWDAVLFGANEEQSHIRETATGEQLTRLLQYGADSVFQRRVTVGEPTVIELQDVTVDGDSAVVDICVTMTNWVEYINGEPKPLDPVERQVVTMSRVEGRWLAANSEQTGATACG